MGAFSNEISTVFGFFDGRLDGLAFSFDSADRLLPDPEPPPSFSPSPEKCIERLKQIAVALGAERSQSNKYFRVQIRKKIQ